MSDKPTIDRIIELAAQATPEALTEMRALLAEQAAAPRVGSITAGGNVNVGKTITIVNGKRQD